MHHFYLLLIFIPILVILFFLNQINQKIIGKPIEISDLNLKNTTSLFWTGGYDSTFRLCQLLLDEKKKVQPIYLTYQYTDSDNPLYQRKSKDKEIIVMNNIIKKLKHDYSHTCHLIKPIVYVHYVNPNQEASDKSLYIHHVLKKYSRPYTQYERMARFSLYYPTSIEVGLDKCGTGLDKATFGHRIGIGSSCRIKDNLDIKYQPLDVYKKFRFPIAHLRKKEMLEVARKNGYEKYLKMSWSCWMPKNGKPCGKCEMCQKRVIKTIS